MARCSNPLAPDLARAHPAFYWLTRRTPCTHTPCYARRCRLHTHIYSTPPNADLLYHPCPSQVRCTQCGAERDVAFNEDEREDVAGGRGDSTYVQKCKDCSRQGNIGWCCCGCRRHCCTTAPRQLCAQPPSLASFVLHWYLSLPQPARHDLVGCLVPHSCGAADLIGKAPYMADNSGAFATVATFECRNLEMTRIQLSVRFWPSGWMAIPALSLCAVLSLRRLRL